MICRFIFFSTWFFPCQKLFFLSPAVCFHISIVLCESFVDVIRVTHHITAQLRTGKLNNNRWEREKKKYFVAAIELNNIRSSTRLFGDTSIDINTPIQCCMVENNFQLIAALLNSLSHSTNLNWWITIWFERECFQFCHPTFTWQQFTINWFLISK